jgi:hypothetical protein
MAEYTGVYLWNRSPIRSRFGGDYVINPEDLGVSPGLIERMERWNDEFGAIARHDFRFPSRKAEEAWARRGLDLAYELQNELGPDVEVRYHEDGDERPIRERHGP